jgi:hypothetical protein
MGWVGLGHPVAASTARSQCGRAAPFNPGAWSA